METSHFRKGFALLIVQFFKMPFTVTPKKWPMVILTAQEMSNVVFYLGALYRNVSLPEVEKAQWMTIRLIIHTKGVGLIPSHTGRTISEIILVCLKEISGQKLKMVFTVLQMTSGLRKSLLVSQYTGQLHDW